MQITLNHFYSGPVKNIIRQVAMTQLEVVRPIAFQVGNSNLLSAGDSVLEDMIEVSSNISNLVYVDPSNSLERGKVVSVTCNVDGTLYAKDLEGSGVQIYSDNTEILHTINQQVSVTVFFIKGIGSYTSDECMEILQESNLYNENIITMNARFCKIKTISFGEDIRQGDGTDIVQIFIETNDGSSAESVLEASVENLIEVFSGIKNGM